ncbi:MAG: excinuclease ABC subunit C [Chloroflexi bacterium]|nr:MAG: excinuclease ABC subunit C [Chloroflexota bacterium]
MERKDLEEQLKALPARPGVYLFKDAGDNVLYVGKAASLYHRVGSYFGSSQDASPKLRRLVAQVAQFEFFVTDSEQEAILLECNLIKKYRPRFNVRLKDDKTYPYLKVSLGEDWPRVYITRRLENDGARYFGPYASAGSVRTTLALLRKLFPFRSCKKSITDSQSQPCLEYHIGRCLGPCTGAVTQEEYRQVIDQIVLFLEGKQEVIVRELRRNMAAAAKNLEFEKAALLRDQVQSVERVIERQKIASPDEEMDVIAFAQARDQAYVLVYSIRNGKLLGRESFVLTGTQGEGPVKIMTSFVQQFYSSAPFIPKQVLLQHSLEDVPMVQQWLESQKRAKVKVWVPRRGVRKGLVDMVAENARQGLEQMRIKLLTEPEVTAKALAELESELQLPRPPRRVECYDIADIRGTSAVGAMVVFEGGQPKRSHYRRFKIKTVPGANDYAMMQEVLWRRFRKAATEPIGSTWATVPDLVLIDGGKGHVNAAAEVVEQAQVGSVSCASIAKGNEAVFLPGMPDPIMLPRDSAGLYLLQRIRDEAHRFAQGYYHKVRHREVFRSALDGIPGIGAKRKRALLKKFRSAADIRAASVEELRSVPGMTGDAARRLKEYL